MPRLSPAILLLFLSLPCSQAAETGPRVASMNLCSDQLLLILAERAQIASVSYLAADPEFSPVADQVGGLHLNHGFAEELLPLAPDLIITGQFSATLAANLLERMDYDVLRLPVANSVEDVFAQIELVAGEVENPERGRQLAAGMREEIAAYIGSLRPRLQGKKAVFYSSNGFGYGRNTLQDSFLDSLGLENAAADLNGPALLPLEVLLREEPDYLFINPPARSDAQLAHPMLRHPALKESADRFIRIELPDTWFQCAGPLFVSAYRQLAGQL